jgi:hypothetical protein
MLYAARCAHLEPENVRASRKKVFSMAEAAAASPPVLRRAARRGLAVCFGLVVVMRTAIDSIAETDN